MSLLVHWNADVLPVEGLVWWWASCISEGLRYLKLVLMGEELAHVFRWTTFSIAWLHLWALPSWGCVVAAMGGDQMGGWRELLFEVMPFAFCPSGQRGGFASECEQLGVQVWEIMGGWACVQKWTQMGEREDKEQRREQARIGVSEHLKIRAFDWKKKKKSNTALIIVRLLAPP